MGNARRWSRTRRAACATEGSERAGIDPRPQERKLREAVVSGMMPPMARQVVVELMGVESRFGLQAVSRQKLYGEKKRLVVDERGEPTVGGWLTTDGAILLLPGGRAEVYLDERGDVVERSELEAVDAEGRLLSRQESTLDVPQALRGPVPAERLLEHVSTSVYLLEPEAIAEALRESLDRGEIWETEFSFTASFARAPMFILKSPEGYFGLVCEPAPLELVRRASPPPVVEDDPLGDDELDFSML